MTKRLGAVNSRLVPRSRNGNRRSRRGPYNWNALQGENRNKATDPFGLREAIGAYNPDGDTKEEREVARETVGEHERERPDREINNAIDRGRNIQEAMKGNNGAIAVIAAFFAGISQLTGASTGSAVVSSPSGAVTVPVVSGGGPANNAPTPAGTYPNLQAISTSLSNSTDLNNGTHGATYVLLPGTDGDAVHQGNSSATINNAYSNGCTTVTALPGGPSATNNYNNVAAIYSGYNIFVAIMYGN